MPKIDTETRAKNKTKLEDAAMRCFLKRGYHGVSMRDIAHAAGVSLGNLYNYSPGKLEIYKSILKRLSQEFVSSDSALFRYVVSSKFPDDLPLLAQAISENVDQFKPYFKMVYIDVVEFNGKHITEAFSGVYDKFNFVLQHRFAQLKGLGPDQSIDPAFAFVALYLQFYYYFALTKIFRAERVYGNLTDQETVQKLIELYSKGLGIKPG